MTPEQHKRFLSAMARDASDYSQGFRQHLIGEEGYRVAVDSILADLTLVSEDDAVDLAAWFTRGAPMNIPNEEMGR